MNFLIKIKKGLPTSLDFLYNRNSDECSLQFLSKKQPVIKREILNSIIKKAFDL